MCMQLVGWALLAVVVGGVIGSASPGLGVIAFVAILMFGAIKGNSTQTQKKERETELTKALWLARDAGAIETDDRNRYRIIDQDSFDELPAEIRMTLDLSGTKAKSATRKKKQEV